MESLANTNWLWYDCGLFKELPNHEEEEDVILIKINFECGGKTYHSITFNDKNGLFFDSDLVCGSVRSWLVDYEKYKFVHFIGGTDEANEDLIFWVSLNAQRKLS